MNFYLRAIRKLVDFTTTSSLLIAAAAAGFLYSAYLQLSIHPDWYLILIVGFATLFMYNLQKMLGILMFGKGFSLLSRPEFILLLAGTLFSALVLIISLMSAESEIILWLIIPALLSVLYAAPIFPYKGIKIAIRGYPYIKIYLILFVWIWVTAIMPWGLTGTEFSADFILFFFQRALFLMAILIPFDIRDLQTDFVFQRTIPQMMGVEPSKKLALLMMAGYAALAIIRWHAEGIGTGVLAGILTTGAAGAIIIRYTDEQKPDAWFTFLIDSLLWLQPVLILLLKGLFK